MQLDISVSGISSNKSQISTTNIWITYIDYEIKFPFKASIFNILQQHAMCLKWTWWMEQNIILTIDRSINSDIVPQLGLLSLMTNIFWEFFRFRISSCCPFETSITSVHVWSLSLYMNSATKIEPTVWLLSKGCHSFLMFHWIPQKDHSF